MAHTPFRGGTDHHLGTDSPRREMLPARSLLENMFCPRMLLAEKEWFPLYTKNN
ncbi:MAG: hypothetical protein IKR77_01065 [Bacteroidales bacterium]|nr:hypothetical protein [Bacteroidales bacterium]